MRPSMLRCLPAFVLLLGCGMFQDEEEPQSQGRHAGREEEVQSGDGGGFPLFHSKFTLYDNTLLSPGRTWIASEARPGDVILITLEGKEISGFTVETLRPYDTAYEESPHPNCFVVDSYYIQKTEGPTEFPGDADDLKVAVEMGGGLYPSERSPNTGGTE